MHEIRVLYNWIAYVAVPCIPVYGMLVSLELVHTVVYTHFHKFTYLNTLTLRRHQASVSFCFTTVGLQP